MVRTPVPARTATKVRVRQVQLPAAGQAAALGRRFARETLSVWGIGHLEEDTVLVVSELVGNAVRHARLAGSALGLRLEADGGRLRIEVTDSDPCLPRPRVPDVDDESGYGFVLVDALSSRWGVRETPGGKAVWVELGTGPAAEPHSA